ncbi:hypothetical protein [Parasitella parasitica]|uniref:Homeobox domain-containing protein n=1 Tax=Parasitella parasitica TaxID=35722 RepID=A0A0B7NLD3_9FUNG|nr:hypothetical protein [Parasitella parasitica]
MEKQKRKITSSKAPQKTVLSTSVHSAENESPSETPQSSASDDNDTKSTSSPGSVSDDGNSGSTSEQSTTTSSSDNFGQIPIRTRIRFAPEDKEVLERAYRKSKRPTNEAKQRLAEDMGTTVSRIQIWFQNRRAKEKKTNDVSDNQHAVQDIGSSSPPSPESVHSEITKAITKDKKLNKKTESSPPESSSIGKKRKKQGQSTTVGTLSHQVLPSGSYAFPQYALHPGGNLLYPLPTGSVLVPEYDCHVYQQQYRQQLQRAFINEKSPKYVDPKNVTKPESSRAGSYSEALSTRKGKFKQKATKAESSEDSQEEERDL